MSPFTTDPEQSLASVGEEALLRQVRHWLGPACPPSPMGMGDDCAVLAPCAQPQLLTVDGLLYGRHFDDQASPEAAAHKLLHRNLSDIAAMGGHPGSAVLALVLGSDVSMKWLQEFFEGLAAACLEAGVALVGGDVAQGPTGVCHAHLSLTGSLLGKPVTRKGAVAGAAICVTGQLGGSRLGHHLSFAARLREGQWLAGRPEVLAMMDVTDGLAKDLPALLPGGAYALLDLPALPLSPAAGEAARQSGRPPQEHALSDGEDYELVVALSPKADVAALTSAFERDCGTRLTCIGKIATGYAGGPLVDAATGQPLSVTGYEHWHMGS